MISNFPISESVDGFYAKIHHNLIEDSLQKLQTGYVYRLPWQIF